MSEGQFSKQVEVITGIKDRFKQVNNGGKGKTAQLRASIENDFKKPILITLDVDQRRRKKEIEKVLDAFIEGWLNRKDTTKEWDILYDLLFPPE